MLLLFLLLLFTAETNMGLLKEKERENEELTLQLDELRQVNKSMARDAVEAEERLLLAEDELQVRSMKFSSSPKLF